MNQIKAVTLLELLVVIIIIAILVTLSIPKYEAMKERGINKEARANLKLIQVAEKIYQIEIGVFWPDNNSTVDVASLNTNLKLDLSSANWGYSVTDSTSGVGPLDAQASRSGGSIPGQWHRAYYIDDSQNQACCCPLDTAPDAACPSEDLCTNLGQSCPPAW